MCAKEVACEAPPCAVWGSAGSGSRQRRCVGAGRGVLWQDGRMLELGTVGGRGSLGLAINNRGQIIGSAGTRAGEDHAFLWEGGKMTDLGTLGGEWSVAYAINNRDQIVGTSG